MRLQPVIVPVPVDGARSEHTKHCEGCAPDPPYVVPVAMFVGSLVGLALAFFLVVMAIKIWRDT